MTGAEVRDMVPPRRRHLLIILFVIYLVLLAWIVLWKLEVPYVGAAAGLPRPFKLVPFVASGDAGASAPLEVLANIAFFVPFGLYLGLLAPAWRWWKVLAIVVGAGLVLETTQHLISTGSFDTTDVITNSAGGMIGFGLLVALRRPLGARTATVIAWVLLAGTMLTLIAIGVFLALHLHYGPRPDVVVRPVPASSGTALSLRP